MATGWGVIQRMLLMFSLPLCFFRPRRGGPLSSRTSFAGRNRSKMTAALHHGFEWQLPQRRLLGQEPSFGRRFCEQPPRGPLERAAPRRGRMATPSTSLLRARCFPRSRASIAASHGPLPSSGRAVPACLCGNWHAGSMDSVGAAWPSEEGCSGVLRDSVVEGSRVASRGTSTGRSLVEPDHLAGQDHSKTIAALHHGFEGQPPH